MDERVGARRGTKRATGFNSQDLAARFDAVRRRLPEVEQADTLDRIRSIWQLKRERRALILAHNYMTPDIYHGVADFTGDSLALAQRAAATDAEVIVVAGVAFMAETAKLLNPTKTVLLPEPQAGCSLADSIRPEDIVRLRERYPGVPVISYVNTTAAVKAASDVCCTSANACRVVAASGVGQAILLPDQNLARYVEAQTGVAIISWPGVCEVHDRFRSTDVSAWREQDPSLRILAHPECRPSVLAMADFVGSTADMIGYLESEHPQRVLLLTEESMTDNLAVQFPTVEFVRPCAACRHMKQVTLEKIEQSLRTLEPRVEIQPQTALRARQALERMLAPRRLVGQLEAVAVGKP